MPTKIEYVDERWNPVTGCSKGCPYCYARRFAIRLKALGVEAYRNGFEPTFHPERLDQPLHWKRPRLIFTCSMGDIFDPNIAMWQQHKILQVIKATPRHTYLILTKRPDLATNPDNPKFLSPWPPNVWLGVSAENQQALKERLSHLFQFPVAGLWFLSLEPLQGEIDLTKALPRRVCDCCGKPMQPWDKHHEETPHPSDRFPDLCGYAVDLPGVEWIIIGAQTNPYRPPKVEWVQSILDQADEAGVPVFMKDNLGPIWPGELRREYPNAENQKP